MTYLWFLLLPPFPITVHLSFVLSQTYVTLTKFLFLEKYTKFYKFSYNEINLMLYVGAFFYKLGRSLRTLT